MSDALRLATTRASPMSLPKPRATDRGGHSKEERRPDPTAMEAGALELTGRLGSPHVYLPDALYVPS